MKTITQIFLEFFHMVWDIYWGLAFGFILSSVIRAFASTESISSRLGKNSVASLGLSTFFGAISSSCSYAAASMSRTLLIKGATWSNAVAFMVASTNLVFEIFIVIVSLLGWAFFGGEVIGGLFFIIISSILIVWIFPSKVKQEAKAHVAASEKKSMDDPHAHHMGHTHSCCGHQMQANHEHTQHKSSLPAKLKEAGGHFYMDVTMVGKDILIGLVVASILMVIVPDSFWKGLFLSGNSHLPHVAILAWNAVIGILIAVFAFVCSVGNIVMATVLWQGGISFGGVIAFILSDLVTVPMLMVFRKYYGNRTMWYLFAVLVISIFTTSLFVDYSFEALHWIPKTHHTAMQMANAGFTWDYQAWLNILFIPVSIVYFYWGKKSTK
jgi:uncharacterized membrane protein YraQ (UPF0718 family)